MTPGVHGILQARILEWVAIPTGGFPGGSAGKESACNVGDLGSVPGLGRSPGEKSGYPLQYSGLENSMDSTGRKESDTTERLSRSLETSSVSFT